MQIVIKNKMIALKFNKNVILIQYTTEMKLNLVEVNGAINKFAN